MLRSSSSVPVARSSATVAFLWLSTASSSASCAVASSSWRCATRKFDDVPATNLRCSTSRFSVASSRNFAAASTWRSVLDWLRTASRTANHVSCTACSRFDGRDALARARDFGGRARRALERRPRHVQRRRVAGRVVAADPIERAAVGRSSPEQRAGEAEVDLRQLVFSAWRTASSAVWRSRSSCDELRADAGSRRERVLGRRRLARRTLGRSLGRIGRDH